MRTLLRKIIKSNIVTYSLVYVPINFVRNRVKMSALQNMIKNKMLLSKLNPEELAFWKRRVANIVAAPDNKFIPRHPDAGKLISGSFIMHNGLKIHPLSYYSLPMLQTLVSNKGVHEPQEERVFGDVLAKLPPNSVILELGSYWAFYSMWFYHSVKNAKCYMIEAKDGLLELGRQNFELNKFKGTFFQAFVASETSTDKDGNTSVCVDDYVQKENIPFIHILHCDIEGHELEMLHGAKKLIESKKVGYFFISTHSNELHVACRTLLAASGFEVIASANLDESYSIDGVLVMKAPYFDGIGPVPIDLRRTKD